MGVGVGLILGGNEVSICVGQVGVNMRRLEQVPLFSY